MEKTTRTMTSDLVIVADGQNSVVRQKLLKEDGEPPFVGYIVWRGTVPEQDVSERTKRLFGDHRFNVFAMSKGYIGG